MHISRYLCVDNAGEGVRDGESTEGGWNLGEGVDIGECVGVFQGMGNEFAGVLCTYQGTCVLIIRVRVCVTLRVRKEAGIWERAWIWVSASVCFRVWVMSLQYEQW